MYAQKIKKETTKSNVVQLASSLTYAGEAAGKRGSSAIGTISHRRASVNDAAKNRTKNNGQWNPANIPAGSVANHSRPYDTLITNLINQLQGQNLSAASNHLLGIYGLMNYGNPGNGQDQTLQHLGNNQNNVAARVDIDSAFDWYMQHICDYPENIFYWPDKTGVNPDEPQTDYGTALNPVPGGWAFNVNANNNNTAVPRVSPRDDEINNRLQNGRNFLTGGFGL